MKCRNFAGSPVVKISPFSAGGAGSIPGQGARIPGLLMEKPKGKTEAVL